MADDPQGSVKLAMMNFVEPSNILHFMTLLINTYSLPARVLIHKCGEISNHLKKNPKETKILIKIRICI